jgi:IclR family pca regulon transcriptional regulator
MTKVKSLVRSFALLEQVANHPTGLVGLATAVDLPTTTAARLLATLESIDALRRDVDGVYRIGPTITALAMAGEFEPTLRDLAHPHMIELVATLNEAVGLSIPVGDEVATIAQVDAPRSVQAEDWSGSRWPMYLGGSGDVMMAHWPQAEVDRRLAGNPDGRLIRTRLERARERGVAWSHGDYVDDLSSVAAPVVDHDGCAVAALYVYGPSYRFPDPETITIVERALRERAARLSRAWAARTRTVGAN